MSDKLLDLEGLTYFKQKLDLALDNYTANNTQRIYHCELVNAANPKEGDICITPEHWEEIPLTHTSGSRSDDFLIPDGVTRIKTSLTGPAVNNWTIVAHIPINATSYWDNGINTFTTGTPPSTYNCNLDVYPGKTGYVYWYDLDESYLQYLTISFLANGKTYEYLDGQWVDRSGMANALDLAETAYQKPIDGIPASDLAAGIIPENIPSIKSGTTEYWNNHSDYIPAANEIIIYTDYQTIIEDNATKNVPGIKIGSGNGYVVDLAFLGEADLKLLQDHINDQVRHITPAERTFWNNKLNLVESISNEVLILNRN